MVVGGGSRLAAQLRRRLPPGSLYVSRHGGLGDASDHRVDAYDAIPPELFDGIACVVNCVGLHKAAPDLLRRINVALPTSLAATARDRGVSRFIHVSSFSIYGDAAVIDRTTPECPTSPYGRSKCEADHALMALDAPGFATTLLRLPMLYDAGSLGKLGQLLRAWRALRFVPVPAGDVERAMIGRELAAEIVAHLIAAPRRGVVLAADPEPFAYRRAAAVRQEALGRLVLPAALTSLARRAAPALAARLLGDSRLSEQANLAIELGLASRLYADIAAARL